MSELEKMDALKERLKVTYSQAKEALDVCEGDLAAALVYLEDKGAGTGQERDQAHSQGGQESNRWDKETSENFVRGVIEQIKSIIQEGNVTRVRLKQGEKTIVEIPATLGVVGLGVLLFSPLLFAVGAIGAATAIIKELTLEVERPDGTVESHTLKFNCPRNKNCKQESGQFSSQWTGEAEWTGETNGEEAKPQDNQEN